MRPHSASAVSAVRWPAQAITDGAPKQPRGPLMSVTTGTPSRASRVRRHTDRRRGGEGRRTFLHPHPAGVPAHDHAGVAVFGGGEETAQLPRLGLPDRAAAAMAVGQRDEDAPPAQPAADRQQRQALVALRRQDLEGAGVEQRLGARRNGAGGEGHRGHAGGGPLPVRADGACLKPFAAPPPVRRASALRGCHPRDGTLSSRRCR